MDNRRFTIKEHLSHLSLAQLQRIASTPADKMVYDGCNFDPANGRFCPLAVALGVNSAKDDKDCYEQIAALGFNPRSMHGVEGDFYRDPHRAEDLIEVVNELLSER